MREGVGEGGREGASAWAMPLVLSEASLPPRDQERPRGGDAGPLSRPGEGGARDPSGPVLSGDVVVPSLCALCVRVLGSRVEEVGSVQWLPLQMVEEVLRRASAAQLREIEEETQDDVGRDLASETGELWKALLERDHRAAMARMVSEVGGDQGDRGGQDWRALYERAEEERAEKLRRLQGQLRGKYEEHAKGKPRTLTTSAAEVTHDQLRARRRKALRESGGVRGRILKSTGLLNSVRTREKLAARGGGIANLASIASSSRGKRAAGDVCATTAQLQVTSAALAAEARAEARIFSRPPPPPAAPLPGTRRLGVPLPRDSPAAKRAAEPPSAENLVRAALSTSATPGTFRSIDARAQPSKQRRVMTLASLRKKGSA